VLPARVAEAIADAADEVASGAHDRQFPVDRFQTGSGTSSNMNANEVIAALAERRLARPVHPNDEVNRGQSSNDVIPTAIHLSAALELVALRRTLGHLEGVIAERVPELERVVKTGRTHLMDAVPITLGQEFSGWCAQLGACRRRLAETEVRVLDIAQGGTAVGTGLNGHPDFPVRFAALLAERTGLPFRPADNLFAAIATQDTAVELSGQLRTTAVALLKIANDLRWMNSGPVAGLGEIRLPELQAGSSIMPGKVNPVIPEAAAMACIQVIGLDAAIALAAQDNRFQLCTMLPLIGANLLEQMELLAAAARLLADKAVAGLTVNREALAEAVERGPMLATALAPRIGYEAAARIARRALTEGRTIRSVAEAETDIPAAELDVLLDPLALTGLPARTQQS
jgi:fumarate hydratase, class II